MSLRWRGSVILETSEWLASRKEPHGRLGRPSRLILMVMPIAGEFSSVSRHISRDIGEWPPPPVRRNKRR